jgi:nicotinamide-nucleotide amidase
MEIAGSPPIQDRSASAAGPQPRAMRRETRTSHTLVVLIEVDEGPDRIDFGGSIHFTIASEDGVASRRSRIYDGRYWCGSIPSSSTLDWVRASLPVGAAGHRMH